MPRGIMIVESSPVSPDRAEEYHKWYDEVHLPEVCAVDGFVSARRFAPLDDDGSFVAIYEIERDDVGAALDTLVEAVGAGKVQMSDALAMDPPPEMRVLKVIADHQP